MSQGTACQGVAGAQCLKGPEVTIYSQTPLERGFLPLFPRMGFRGSTVTYAVPPSSHLLVHSSGDAMYRLCLPCLHQGFLFLTMARTAGSVLAHDLRKGTWVRRTLILPELGQG